MAKNVKFYLYVFILASCTFAIGWFMLFYGGHLQSRPESFYLVVAGQILWWPAFIFGFADRFFSDKSTAHLSYTLAFIIHFFGYFSAALALAAYRSWRMKRKLAIE